jgi:nucleotide-binding universal stress UspA family protein
MYKNILIPVENKETDATILDHIRSLGRLTHSKITLLHVADGWAARNYDQLDLQESEEMKADRQYLERRVEELSREGFETSYILAMGDPAEQIIKIAKEKEVDLIAMTTHGHRFLGDIIYGSTADKVRHHVDIPVLLLKVRK